MHLPGTWKLATLLKFRGLPDPRADQGTVQLTPLVPLSFSPSMLSRTVVPASRVNN